MTAGIFRTSIATLALLVITSAPPAARAQPAASSTEPTNAELLEKIRQLEQRLSEVEARRAMPNALQDPSHDSAATDAVTRAMLSDADRRSSLFGTTDGFTAGYTSDRGFVIQSTDGKFLLHPWLYMQFRNVTNWREDAADGSGSDLQNGFELRRAKLIFDGNLFSPDLTYLFIWATDRKSGSLGLEEAWVRYQIADSPFAIRAGQIRSPFDHEQLMFATRLMTADRSLADDVLAANEGLTQGVSLAYADGPWRIEAAVTDGLRSGNTNFQDFPTTSADWGVAGRAEYKFMGKWDQYSDFTALGNHESLLVAGIGADYTEAGDTAALLHVADVHFESDKGLSLYAAYMGRYTQNNGKPPGSTGGATGNVPVADTYDASVRLQAGYLIDTRWEAFARYEYIWFDPAMLPVTVSHKPVHEMTVGVNYYFYRHRAKLTTDLLYLPNGSPVGDDGAGILATKGGRELVLRMQFQLLI